MGDARDVTGCGKPQRERDQLAELHRLQIDRLPLAYVATDANYRVCEWNVEAEKTFGYSKQEALGQVCLDLICVQPIDSALHHVLRRLQAGDMDAHSVNVNRTKDGREIICDWFNTPLLDLNGRFCGVSSVARDITRKQREEREFERSRLRFQALFDNALEAILLADDEGRYVDVNPAATALLGFTREELIGLPIRDFEQWAQLKGVPHLSGEGTLACKDGSLRDVEFRSVAHVVPGLHLSICHDIAEHRASEVCGRAELSHAEAESHNKSPGNSHEVVMHDNSGVPEFRVPGDTVARIAALTARQRRVLALICDGATTKEIGARLDVSSRTVEHDRARIFTALEVQNALQLVRLVAQIPPRLS